MGDLNSTVDAGLLRADGTLDDARLASLHFLIETARSRGMTVDVTFSRGAAGASDGSFDNYQTAMIAVANALLPYRNVFFDLGNERDVTDARYISPEDAGMLATAVRVVDGQRLVTAIARRQPS